jgi:ABC-type multidrug transport system fused ATPase/permease subunit
MSDGLQTIIGERGLNISGGQKQRLNLARLFYHPLPLFLLDDPFSAVDVGTEKKLIDSLFSLKSDNHSFLVITQRYEFLKQCDRVIYMENGEIKFNGTYPEFISHEKYKKFIAGDVN